MQYIHETEVGSSNTQADIYGALVEVFLFDFGLNFAYNKAVEHKEKRSFSGIGGGSMYTSMDTMTIDEMTYDREFEAIVAGFVYNFDDWNLLYAYGNFEGKANSIGEKAHIVEQNFGLTYTLNDEFEFGALYVKEEDKYDASNADYNWERVQVIAKYDF